jgi:hypothetical protein
MTLDIGITCAYKVGQGLLRPFFMRIAMKKGKDKSDKGKGKGKKC